MPSGVLDTPKVVIFGGSDTDAVTFLCICTRLHEWKQFASPWCTAGLCGQNWTPILLLKLYLILLHFFPLDLNWYPLCFYSYQLNSFILNSIPVVVIVISFGIFSLLGGDLTPAKAFTSLSLFAVLRFPLFMLPITITQVFFVKRLLTISYTDQVVSLPFSIVGEPSVCWYLSLTNPCCSIYSWIDNWISHLKPPVPMINKDKEENKTNYLSFLTI